MIGYLEGKVRYIGDKNTICVVCGGVGYNVIVTGALAMGISEDDDIILYVYTNYGKDGAVALYGFESKEELDVCKILLNATGVGPKSVQALYELYSYNEVVEMVLTEDLVSLAKASGITERIATKIVADCKKKLEKSNISVGDVVTKADINSEVVSNVVDALVALGYTKVDAIKTVKSIDKAETYDESDLLSLALRKIISF